MCLTQSVVREFDGHALGRRAEDLTGQVISGVLTYVPDLEEPLV